MAITTTGISHIRLTVRDLAASKNFYDTVFGWDIALAIPDGADEETRDKLWFLFGGIIYDSPSGFFGLRPVAAGDDEFSEDRVGLDHLALSVASRGDLEDAIAVLDSLGAPHGDIKDLGSSLLLEFRDPDGIALELSAPKE